MRLWTGQARQAGEPPSTNRLGPTLLGVGGELFMDVAGEEAKVGMVTELALQRVGEEKPVLEQLLEGDDLGVKIDRLAEMRHTAAGSHRPIPMTSAATLYPKAENVKRPA